MWYLNMIYRNGSATIVKIGDVIQIHIPDVGLVAEVTKEEGGYITAMEMVDIYLESQAEEKKQNKGV
jgi:hypothetical protein